MFSTSNIISARVEEAWNTYISSNHKLQEMYGFKNVYKFTNEEDF